MSRSLLRAIAASLGLRPDPGRTDPAPVPPGAAAVIATLQGVAFALLMWPLEGGSTASLISRGVLFGAFMFSFYVWRWRRHDGRTHGTGEDPGPRER